MINPIQRAYDYARDIQNGIIPACKYIKLAVEKYYDQHARSEELGIFFDEDAAQFVLDFFGLLKFTAGSEAGKPFKVEGWQAFLVANLFGWKKYSENGRAYRLYREAYIEVPKKSGKTELAAAIAIYMLVADDEQGAQVYTAAYTRDQAKLCFAAAQQMVKKSPSVRKKVVSLTNNMSVKATFSTMSAVSHDAKNSEGKNTHCAIYDEFHVHLTDKLKMSLESGMASRMQPILFTITTAGDNTQSPCYEFRGTCINILEGRSKITDTFALIFTIDEGDDWEDESTWYKANPNLGVSKQLDYLRNKFKKAKENGREEVDFKTKQLDIWCNSAETWIPEETWTAGADPGFEIPAGAVYYAGVDLGRTNDFSAYSRYYPDYNYTTTRYYVAEEAAKYANRSGIDYLQWAADGHLILTPGKTTNHEIIKNDIVADAERDDLMFLGVDPYSTDIFKGWLEDELGETYAGTRSEDGSIKYKYHLKCQNFSQKAVSISPPTVTFEEMVLEAKLKHDGNPISKWMLSNVAIKTDASGNIKVAKDKSKDKVDGIVAKIMAIGEYQIWNSLINPYGNSSTYGVH